MWLGYLDSRNTKLAGLCPTSYMVQGGAFTLLNTFMSIPDNPHTICTEHVITQRKNNKMGGGAVFQHLTSNILSGGVYRQSWLLPAVNSDCPDTSVSIGEDFYLWMGSKFPSSQLTGTS